MRQLDVRDFSVRCDAPDPVAKRIGEPDGAIRPRGYPLGESIGIDREALGRPVRSHLPDASPWYSVNHRLPSGPAAIAYGACVPSGIPVELASRSERRCDGGFDGAAC